MELDEALRRRAMVRRFTADPVDPTDLDAVLDAAARAPSAGFSQGVSYQLITGEDVTRFWRVTGGDEPPDAWQRGMRGAPALILVWTSQQDYLDRYAESDKGWTDRDPDRWSAPYWWVDAGMGVMAGLLTVTSRGLGACFFGVPPQVQNSVREAFGVPPEQASVGVLAIGHPAQVRRRARRARRAVVHRGRWAR